MPEIKGFNEIDKDSPLGKWYHNNVPTPQLERLYEHFKTKRYYLDKSGFMFRNPIKNNCKEKVTCSDVVFTRPTDLHYHEDVTQHFVALSGAADFFIVDYSTGIRNLEKHWILSDVDDNFD